MRVFRASFDSPQLLLVFAIVVLLFSLVYVPFPAINYDGNAIIELIAIRDGGALQLLKPNHLLYRPLIWVLEKLVYAETDAMLRLQMAQAVTAVAGALTCGLWAVAALRLGVRPGWAALFTVAMGTSWAMWVFSTDALYIVPAALPVAGAIALAAPARTAKGIGTLASLAALTAVAIGLWQANLFATIGVAAILIADLSRSRSQRAICAAAYVSLSGLLTLLLYVVAFRLVGGTSLTGFVPWLTTYDSRLPMWGKWEFDRVALAAESWVASIVPLWSGLGLRSLAMGRPEWNKLPQLFALAGFTFILGMTAAHFSRLFKVPGVSGTGGTGDFGSQRQARWTLMALVVGFLAYLPFVIWWDPTDPKWLIAANQFMWLAVALLWSRAALGRLMTGAAVLSISFVTVATFTSTILPDHLIAGPAQEMAKCVAGQVGEQDVVILADWDYSSALDYLHDRHAVSVFEVAAAANAPETPESSVRQLMFDTWTTGGKVLACTPSSYSSGHLEWVEQVARIDYQQLIGEPRTPTFVCGQRAFVELP